ncbi:MAG: hypothetical protein ACLFO6_06300 [Archaeoglobaceae archaeon]
MKTSKILLIFLALVAIGFLVLPSTVSLFAGQHYWYDLSEGEKIATEIACEKCHADIADEMDLISGPHTGETGYGRMECEFCHRVRYADYEYATDEGGTVTPGKYAHAASTIACMDCHRCINGTEFDNVVTAGTGSHAYSDQGYFSGSDCEKCHGDSPFDNDPDIPYAGGFGLTNASGDTGSMAAHMKFVIDATDNDLMLDSNEACIACHTGIAVKINWTHARAIEFDIGVQKPVVTDAGTHNWTVDNWDYSGTANATSWGNTTGFGNSTIWNEWPGDIGDIYE